MLSFFMTLSLRTGLTLTAIFFSFSFVNAEESTRDAQVWVDLLKGSKIDTIWKAATASEAKNIGNRWQLNNGVLSLDSSRTGKGGSIETKKTYFNFELLFEFKIAKDSNSGIKYRMKNSAGIEYQLLDDEAYANSDNLGHRTGALYAFQGAPIDKKLHLIGQWNTGRILMNGKHIEHWLNGVKVASIERGTALWNQRFKESRFFKEGILDFGTHKGPIHIQDFSDTNITFKQMLIREIADK